MGEAIAAGSAQDGNTSLSLAPSNTSPNTGPAQPVPTSSATRGKRAPGQPRGGVRRSQAERQQLEDAANARRKGEAAGKAPGDSAQSKQGGSRGGWRGRGNRGRGRGRGGAANESARTPFQAIASGPFGAEQASAQKKAARRWNSGASGTRATRSRDTISAANTTAAIDGKPIKEESATGVPGDGVLRHRTYVNIEDGGYISSDEDEEGNAIQRVNVEDLGVIDLMQDDGEHDQFAPIRVTRTARKGKAMGLNADGATNQDGNVIVDANDTTGIQTSEKKKGKQRAKDMQAVDEKSVFQATYSDSDSDLEGRATVKQDPEGEPQVPSSNAEPTELRPSSPEARRKGKAKAKNRALSTESFADEPNFQLQDEREEWQRQQKDLTRLREQLGPLNSAPTDHDGDVDMTKPDKREEEVYLFQFPPILPDLSPLAIKPDPTTEADSSAVVDEDNKESINIRDKFPSGAVGKLRVHASGRVTLDWGGTSLCVGMGTEVSFLQDVLVTTLPDAKTDDDDEEMPPGMATSMGPVNSKFVVTPDWEEILR